MRQWEISKHLPLNGEVYNNYIKKQWVSFDQIGESFGEKVLTPEEYFRTEQLYVDAVMLFMKFLKIDQLYVKFLDHQIYHNDPYVRDVNGNIIEYFDAKSESINRFEKSADKYPEAYPVCMKSLFYTIKQGQWLNHEQSQQVIKLALRLHLGLKLSYYSDLEIEFGYEYYMYVASRKNCMEIVRRIEEEGLYVSEIKYYSPWEDN